MRRALFLCLILGPAGVSRAQTPAPVSQPQAISSYGESVGQARRLYLLGSFQEAVSAFRRIPASASKDERAVVRSFRAWAEEGAGLFKEMSEDARKTASRLKGAVSRPGAPALQESAYGSALFLSGHDSAALEHFNAALSRKNSSAAALAGRARVLGDLGENERALKDLDEALKSQESSLYEYFRAEVLRRLGNLKESQDGLFKALRLNPRFTSAYLLLGSILAEQGDSERALKSFSKATLVSPEDPRGFAARGGLELMRGATEQALSDLDAAVSKSGPFAFEARAARAEAFLSLGWNSRARADLEEALSLPAWPREQWLRLGRDFERLGLWKQGLSAYSKAIGSSGEDAAPASKIVLAGLLGRARMRGYMGQPWKGLGDIRTALKLFPDSAAAWTAMGLTQAGLGRQQEALDALSKALDLDEKNVEARLARAALYEKSRDLETALNDLDAILKIKPKGPSAHLMRSRILSRFWARRSEALADARAAAQEGPSPRTLAWLMRLERLGRDVPAAFKTVEEAGRLKGSPTAELLSEEALVWALAGERAKALAAASEAVKAAPGKPGPWIARGRARRVSGDAPGAAQDLHKALELDADDAEAHRELGAALADEGDLPRALLEWKSAAALDPWSLRARLELCRGLRMGGKAAEALKACGEALALDPTSGPAFYEKAVIESATGRYKDALADADSALKAGVLNAELLLSRSFARAATGSYAEAIPDFDRAQTLHPGARCMEQGPDPDHCPGDFVRGVISLSLGGGWRESDLHAVLLLADALLLDAQTKPALNLYMKALSRKPVLMGALFGRSRCLWALGEKHDAQADLETAVKLFPQSPEPHVRLAVMMISGQSYDGALAEAAKALALSPLNMEARHWEGNARYFKKDYKGALEDYSAAAQGDPLNPVSYDSLGLAYLALGQGRQAAVDFSQAAALDPASRYYRHRASAFEKIGDRDDAAADMRIAMLLNKDLSKSAGYKKILDSISKPAP